MGFDEDRSQVRTAAGPRIMASLRNLVITNLRRIGGAMRPTVANRALGWRLRGALRYGPAGRRWLWRWPRGPGQ